MKNIFKTNFFKDIDRCNTIIVVLFVLFVVLMNIFANKCFPIESKYFALDFGVICSGFTFLFVDILTHVYGETTSTNVLIFSIICNLFVSLMFYIVGIIPGFWSQSLLNNSQIINNAINNTFKSNIFVLFGSTVAFLISGMLNNKLNALIGKNINHNKNSYQAFALRSFVSTLISQFIDNFIFNLIVLRVIMSWNLYQCATCSIITAIFELVCEIMLSPIGYMVVKKIKIQYE